MTDFDRELVEYEAWVAAGRKGNCPLCGAEEGYLHGRKFCMGESPTPEDGWKLTPGQEKAFSRVVVHRESL